MTRLLSDGVDWKAAPTAGPALAASRDAQWLVRAFAGRLSLLHAETLEEAAHVMLPTVGACEVGFVYSPGVRVVAVGRNETTSSAWAFSVPDLEPIAQRDLQGQRHALAFFGERVVLVEDEGDTIEIVRLTTRQLVQERVPVHARLRFAAPAPDDRILVDGRDHLELWDLRTRSPVYRLNLKLSGPPCAAGFAARGRLLWVASDPRAARLDVFRYSDGRPQLQLNLGMALGGVVGETASPRLVAAMHKGPEPGGWVLRELDLVGRKDHVIPGGEAGAPAVAMCVIEGLVPAVVLADAAGGLRRVLLRALGSPVMADEPPAAGSTAAARGPVARPTFADPVATSPAAAEPPAAAAADGTGRASSERLKRSRDQLRNATVPLGTAAHIAPSSADLSSAALSSADLSSAALSSAALSSPAPAIAAPAIAGGAASVDEANERAAPGARASASGSPTAAREGVSPSSQAVSVAARMAQTARGGVPVPVPMRPAPVLRGVASSPSVILPPERAIRRAPSDAANWRDPLIAWARPLLDEGAAASSDPHPGGAAPRDGEPLILAAAAFSLADEAPFSALALLYAARLLGRVEGVAAATLARAAGWPEALAGGALARAGILRERGGRVRLHAALGRLLDGHAPRAAVVSSTSQVRTELEGVSRYPLRDEDDVAAGALLLADEIGRAVALVELGGVAEASLGARIAWALVEARYHDAVPLLVGARWRPATARVLARRFTAPLILGTDERAAPWPSPADPPADSSDRGA